MPAMLFVLVSISLSPAHSVTQFNNCPLCIHVHIATSYTIVSICRVEVQVLVCTEFLYCANNLLTIKNILPVLNNCVHWISPVECISPKTTVVISSNRKHELHEHYCALDELLILQQCVAWVIGEVSTTQSCLFTGIGLNTI